MFNFFKRKPPVPVQQSPAYVITEGVLGYWHYHVSRDDMKTRSLCGKQTMHTSIPLARWGTPFGEHFPKRPTWCQTCRELMGDVE